MEKQTTLTRMRDFRGNFVTFANRIQKEEPINMEEKERTRIGDYNGRFICYSGNAQR